jgi:hypothetical protein
VYYMVATATITVWYGAVEYSRVPHGVLHGAHGILYTIYVCVQGAVAHRASR